MDPGRALRIRRHCPRRGQPFLAPGSSTRTTATTRARGGRTPEIRTAVTVAVVDAWVGGYPGGGHGGYGGRRSGGESDEERQKMRDLFTPAKVITLSMTGAEVDLVDDRDRKRAFMTDGRKLQKSKDEGEFNRSMQHHLI